MSRVDGKPYFVYVLWSASGRRFYVGISEDPDHRLEQHNSGAVAGWTKRHRPWTMILTETFDCYADARRRELDLKSQKGGIGFFAKTALNPADFGRGS